jgi:acetyl-CoA carboxylase biotin carboxyl carrier protein
VVELEKIRELVQMMMENDLVEISLRDGEEEVSLKRPGHGLPASVVVPQLVVPPGPAPLEAAGPAPGPPADPDKPPAPEDDGLVPIRSPMVGTFYTAASPEAPPYVELGTTVTADTVVCIVEAMKVFNEIKAEVSGTVERVLVSNQDAVEYGQELFLVRPPA